MRRRMIHVDVEHHIVALTRVETNIFVVTIQIVATVINAFLMD